MENLGLINLWMKWLNGGVKFTVFTQISLAACDAHMGAISSLGNSVDSVDPSNMAADAWKGFSNNLMRVHFFC